MTSKKSDIPTIKIDNIGSRKGSTKANNIKSIDSQNESEITFDDFDFDFETPTTVKEFQDHKKEMKFIYSLK
jgi:hypothetical protein